LHCVSRIYPAEFISKKQDFIIFIVNIIEYMRSAPFKLLVTGSLETRGDMLTKIPTARQVLKSLGDPALLRDRPYIAGAWTVATSSTAVVDPATGDEIAQVADCDSVLLGQAIDATDNAFANWRDSLARERGGLLLKWASLIREHAHDLAVILTAEQDKPLNESKAEILDGVDFIEWFAAEGERAYGETIPAHKPWSRLFVSMQPVGVSAAVTPWNFPRSMIARKAAAALAAGCPVIVKPAFETPLSALALAELACRAGFPAGVFQVVTGDAVQLTEGLLSDERVRAFSFTGSTEVGRLLLGKAVRTVKKVSMELGGHAPFIVFDDADHDEAVEGASPESSRPLARIVWLRTGSMSRPASMMLSSCGCRNEPEASRPARDFSRVSTSVRWPQHLLSRNAARILPTQSKKGLGLWSEGFRFSMRAISSRRRFPSMCATTC
jgi:hypothetical protein